MTQLKIWGFFTVLIFFTACGFQQSSHSDEEEFDDFYTKFHKDSLFQMERIDFPLNGTTSFLEARGAQPTFWYRDEWKLHNLLSDTMDLNQNFISADSILVDVIYDNKGNGITRYFTLRDNKWYLTYYADHAPIEPDFKRAK